MYTIEEIACKHSTETNKIRINNIIANKLAGYSASNRYVFGSKQNGNDTVAWWCSG